MPKIHIIFAKMYQIFQNIYQFIKFHTDKFANIALSVFIRSISLQVLYLINHFP
jgi:hypothetical protein